MTRLLDQLLDSVCRLATLRASAASAEDAFGLGLGEARVDVAAAGARLEASLTDEMDIEIRISTPEWSPAIEKALHAAVRASPSPLADILHQRWSVVCQAAESAQG